MAWSYCSRQSSQSEHGVDKRIRQRIDGLEITQRTVAGQGKRVEAVWVELVYGWLAADVAEPLYAAWQSPRLP